MDDSDDLIDRLGQDISMMILMCLEDPSDLVHASAVSSSWRQFGEFFFPMLFVCSVCLVPYVDVHCCWRKMDEIFVLL